MIFYRLDYVIEREHAARRDAAKCVPYARPQGGPTDKLRRLAKQLVGRDMTRRSQKNFLRKLSGVKLSEVQAQTYWPRVLDHKWYLSERLGRDVGLRVAALDYFENIERLQPPARFRLFADQGLPPKLPMMLPFGERA